MVDFKSLPQDQQLAHLMRFLHAVARHYLAADRTVLYFENVVPAALAEYNPLGAEAWVELAKIHFLPSLCEACDILNEEAFAENNDTGEEGPLVDYQLTGDNLAQFMDKEGSNGLYEHLQHHLPAEEWERLSHESERRIHLDAIDRGVIIHTPYQGPGAEMAEACRTVLHPSD